MTWVIGVLQLQEEIKAEYNLCINDPHIKPRLMLFQTFFT